MQVELTNKQIARQDYVDNSIFDLLQSLNSTDKKIDWDIEMIGQVRDSIKHLFVNKNIYTEQEFYPYLEQ
jgi:predicted membrane GTPase involved in stress response